MSSMKTLTLSTFFAVLLVPALAMAFTAPKDGLETSRIHTYRTFDAATQAHMTKQSQAFADFQALYGTGWTVNWDERSGTALRIYGQRIELVDRKAPQAEVTLKASAFLDSIQPLLAVDPSALVLSGATRVGDTWYIKYDRLAGGIPVDGAAVELRITRGAIVLIKIDTHPAAHVAVAQPRNLTREMAANAAITAIQPLAGPAKVGDLGRLVIYPLAHADRYEYRLAWVNEVTTNQIKGRWRTHVDAVTGEVLFRENLVRHITGTIRGSVEPRTVGDPMQDQLMPNITVTINGTSGDADGQGAYDVNATGTGSVSLYGAYTNVNNDAGSDGSATFSATASPANHTITSADATQAEIAAYRHTETVKDWARKTVPGLGWVDQRLGVNVNISSSCNAYWDGSTTNFFSESNQCNNTARIADVVYHEFGHGFHQNIMVGGTMDGSIGEGSGDYISVTLTEDPRMAVGFFKGGGTTWIRDAENDKVYPDDLQGEPHADGEIWVAAMWDLRKLLVERYGAAQGPQVSDQIFAGILRSGPRFDDVYTEALLADDDDGDLNNGTPNQCEIEQAFGEHGLAGGGGGGGGFLPLTHTEVLGQGVSVDQTIKVVTLAGGGNSACAVGDPDTVLLRYSIDGGATFTDAPMSGTGNANEYSADIPGQPDGTVVNYYIVASKDTVSSTTPPRAPNNLYGFYVGKLGEVFFDDFEQDLGWTHGLDFGDPNNEGADDWQRGAPQGAGGDPPQAYSGSSIWGNDLGFEGYNGLYQSDIVNWLESPAIDCSKCKGARLQFRRWLQVEDALYDQARIYINGTEVWKNEQTTGGNKHRQDGHWTFYDIDISDLADGEAELVIRFELASDAGLEFGGWNVDDVGVFTAAVDDNNEGDGDGPSCQCSIKPTQQGSPVGTLAMLLLSTLAAGAAVARRRRRC